MTATMPPLGPTADTWGHSPVVAAIAEGPDWPQRVAAYWSATVADKAHDLAHPRPVAGCVGCPQTGECRWCGLPVAVCESPIEHDRRRKQGEVSLLIGVADYRELGNSVAVPVFTWVARRLVAVAATDLVATEAGDRRG